MPSGFKDEKFKIIDEEEDQFAPSKSEMPKITIAPDLYDVLVEKLDKHYPHIPERIGNWILSLRSYLGRPITHTEELAIKEIEKYEAYHLYWIFFIQADKIKVLIQKGAFYGKSFCKKGWYSVFHNIQRKYDAVETILFDNAIQKRDSERIYKDDGANFEDSLRDLSNYSDLGWVYLLEKLIQEEESEHGKESS